MKFDRLNLDTAIVKSMIFAGCGKCDMVDENTTKCSGCTTSNKYIFGSFQNPYSSIVMMPTSLYERFFHTGPVNYFMVIAGYSALLDYIAKMCHPDCKLIIDKDWNDGARATRTLVSGMFKESKGRITHWYDIATDRLSYINAMEHQILLAMAMMEECVDPSSKTLAVRIEANYLLRCNNYLTKTIVEWTWDRCGHDKLADRIENDERWNVTFQDYKNTKF